MYFATFVQNGKEAVGVLSKEQKKVTELSSILGRRVGSLLEFIEEASDRDVETIRDYIEKGTDEGASLESVNLLAPIPVLKRNAFCLGLNYKEHVKESQSVRSLDKLPEHPVFFSKAAIDVIGTGMEIDSHPDLTSEVDYEVELAVVIGKAGKNIPEESAYDHIFGFTILNDITARDIQRRHFQWFKGKSLDTFTAMGPYLVHKSVFDLPLELDVKSFVNGELRQNSNTKHMIFSILRIISELSQSLTLMPGDVISTGTPEGVGMGFNPPKYLKRGDVVECYVEGIGTLRNVVR